MPSARVKPENMTVDASNFSTAIDSYVSGRVVLDNPTMSDYLQHYGSNRAIAEKLVEAGYYTKVASAMRQVQRLNKNPNLKVTPRIKEALGSLALPEKRATIKIGGYASYDGGATGWRPMTISHTFTPSQMRRIISETQELGNQAGYDSVNRLYGIPVNFNWLADVKISITPA